MVILAVIFIMLLTAAPSFADDTDTGLTNLGGDLSFQNHTTVAFQLPAPNISSQERKDFHVLGFSNFTKQFNLSDKNGKFKLGPFFNHISCIGCHVNDGRGALKFTKRPPGSPMLIKVSLKGLKKNGAPKDVPGVGEQLQDHVVGGGSRFNIRLKYRYSAGAYPDGTPFELRRPVVSFKIPGINAKKVVSSLRQTPPVVGMGLLEAVPEETLLALADPDDTKTPDGISGEVNYVPNREGKGLAVGRFGFRASHPTVRQQTAAALFFDMGLNNSIFKNKGEKSEVSAEVLGSTTFYLHAATVPVARNQTDPDVIAGFQLFQQVGCHSCHQIRLKTGSHEVPEISDQEFHPFTDLLLHDMGDGLADTRPEFSASGSEWRTSPLWGIGLTETLAPPSGAGFLHDGRARTIEEAILWHGGEAAAAQQAFMALTAAERAQLIKFLQSI